MQLHPLYTMAECLSVRQNHNRMLIVGHKDREAKESSQCRPTDLAGTEAFQRHREEQHRRQLNVQREYYGLRPYNFPSYPYKIMLLEQIPAPLRTLIPDNAENTIKRDKH